MEVSHCAQSEKDPHLGVEQRQKIDQGMRKNGRA